MSNAVASAVKSFSFFKPEAIVGVHPDATSAQQQAIKECLYDSGVRAVYLEPIPILAARGAELPFHDTHGRVIVDIGASTINIAVVSYGGIVNARTVDLGGRTFDRAIANLIEKKYGVRVGAHTVESLKRTIGSAIPVRKEKSMEVSGFLSDSARKNPKGEILLRSKVTQVTTHDIVEAIAPVLDSVEKAISGIINTVPPQMTTDITHFGIVLCGGAAQLHFFPEFLENRLGIFVSVADDPRRCVVKGAGSLLRGVNVHRSAILAKNGNR